MSPPLSLSFYSFLYLFASKHGRQPREHRESTKTASPLEMTMISLLLPPGGNWSTAQGDLLSQDPAYGHKSREISEPIWARGGRGSGAGPTRFFQTAEEPEACPLASLPSGKQEIPEFIDDPVTRQMFWNKLFF